MKYRLKQIPRVLAVFLAVVMAFTVVPTSVLAAGDQPNIDNLPPVTDPFGCDGYHSYNDCEIDDKCLVCGEENVTKSHTGGTATCIEEAECVACGKKYGDTIDDHSYDFPKYDTQTHWMECVCGEKAPDGANDHNLNLVMGESTHRLECICGYFDEASEKPHTFDSYFHLDENVHCKECVCGAKDFENVTKHDYTDCLDTTCGDCGATREAPGNSYDFPKYDTQTHTHWMECVCGEKEFGYGHTLTPEFNNDNHWLSCFCGYVELESINGHAMSRNYNDTHDWLDCDCGYTTDKRTHSFTKKYDTNKHWQECTCGKTIAKANHTYVKKVTPATLKKNGKVVEVCACGKKKSESTVYYAKTVKLSTTSYTYNGKSKKPSVSVKDSEGKTVSSKNYTVKYASGRKSVGRYKVTVTFKGNYSGTKTLYFTINPKKTSIKSLKAGKKAFTVKYSKQTSGAGYQIQYSTSSKFKSAKTVKVTKNKTVSKTVKKLKAKKTYYVRVRTYKKVSGKYYYSSWSSAKKVKTK